MNIDDRVMKSDRLKISDELAKDIVDRGKTFRDLVVAASKGSASKDIDPGE